MSEPIEQWDPPTVSCRISVPDDCSMKVDASNSRYFGSHSKTAFRSHWGGKKAGLPLKRKAWEEVCKWVGIEARSASTEELVDKAVAGAVIKAPPALLALHAASDAIVPVVLDPPAAADVPFQTQNAGQR